MTTIAQGLKRTPVGPVPEDWAVATIGDIASTSSGTTPPRALFDRYYANGSINWAKTLDLHGAEIEDTDERVTPAALEETSLRLYPAGTVLVAMYGGFNQIGRTGLLRQPAAVNQAISAIQVSPTRLYPDYLLAVLNLSVHHWKSVASSSRKDPNITSADVRGFPIAIPPMNEQHAIAAALRDITSLTRSLDNLIAKKRDLKQAAMQQLLSSRRRLSGSQEKWCTRSFDEVLTRVNARPHQLQATEYLPTGDHPVVDQGQRLIAGFCDRYDLVLKCPPHGVIVFGDHTCIVKYVNFDFVVGADGTQVLFPRKGNSARFLAFYLQYHELAQSGYNRHFKLLRQVPFHVPTEHEQNAIAGVLASMDEDLTVLEARREKALALKQAMMHQLLTGRIRLI